MKSDLDQRRRVFLGFSSIDELEEKFTSEGEGIGFFHSDPPALQVGRKVSILISIRNIIHPLDFEGAVLWRSPKFEDESEKKGSFIGLDLREGRRFTESLRFLRMGCLGSTNRTQVRYPVYLKATYRLSENEYTSHTKNVSRRGAYLLCAGQAPREGDQLVVSLQLDPVKEKDACLDSTVRWLDRNGKVFGMGVEFTRDQPDLPLLEEAIGQVEKSWITLQSSI
jgi:Tfp pilus assembly protein PilZ